MPKFKVGDHVEWIGSLVPTYMRNGVVTAVTPHPEFPDQFTEYEVDFKYVKGTVYENQLRLAAKADSAAASR
jgi:hypothetical protein